MKIFHRINVFLAGVIDFRKKVAPYYEDKVNYRWYNGGRNIAHRATFHLFEGGLYD